MEWSLLISASASFSMYLKIPIKRLILSDEQKTLGGRSQSTLYRSGPSLPIFEIPPFNLQGLPPELRVFIFRECILAASDEACNGKTPSIVKALRSVPHLYREILDIFYSLNVCVLSYRNRVKASYMPGFALKKAISLRIGYGYAQTSWYVRCFGLWYGKQPSNAEWTRIAWNQNTCLRRGSHSRTVFQCPSPPYYHSNEKRSPSKPSKQIRERELVELIRNFVVLLPCLERLVVDVPMDTREMREMLLSKRRDTRLIRPALLIGEAIGNQHQFGWTENASNGLYTLTWAAMKGQTLTWTDKQYCDNVPWARFTLPSYSVASLLHRRTFSFNRNLHFLGLNPRVMLRICRRKSCWCARKFYCLSIKLEAIMGLLCQG